MILGTKVRYAVMALVEMARCNEDKPVSIAVLAERQEITVPYLEQIFSKLRVAGLVKSVRGPNGGYILAKQADKIMIFDIVSAVEESVKMTRCNSKENDGCMEKKTRCVTHHLWEGLEKQIYSYLSSISLTDVCENNVKKCQFI